MGWQDLSAAWIRSALLPAGSDVQKQMILDRGFEFLLLDPDVSLSYCRAAVLQELLDQGDVVAVCFVDFGGEEFPEAVSADPRILSFHDLVGAPTLDQYVGRNRSGTNLGFSRCPPREIQSPQ